MNTFVEKDPYRPTGRRHYNLENKNSWNFLTHYPHNNKNIQFKDKPNLNKCRFGKGFQRRPLNDIWPNKEENRVKQWENAMKRRANHEQTRKEFLSSKNNINGNLIKCNIPKEKERPLFQSKRKEFIKDSVCIRDKHIRDKVSKNRFFHPKLSKRPQIKKITPHRSPNSGSVLDAFSGHGY